MGSIREFLERATLTREEVERFLNPKEPNWAQFDPELGYTLRDCVERDGVDNSYPAFHFGRHGERRMINALDLPCRINTYGNSFTMCNQVGDGETWQEYLAAHLGEPVRNFGVGGYGVYQACKRMMRNANGPVGAEYIILNIWGLDDHYRSLDSWRWLRVFEWLRSPRNKYLFHANPWDHLRIHPVTARMEERRNAFSTPESLYRLCDKKEVYAFFHDDVALHLFLAQRPGMDVNWELLEQLAHALELDLDFQSSERRVEAAQTLYSHCALKASTYTLQKLQAFARATERKLLVVLSYADHIVVEACRGRTRPDQPFLEFLERSQIPYVDLLQKHVEDYQQFNLSPRAYVARYFIGHYSPRGNHFVAFAMKNQVVEWLEPKPPAYQDSANTIGFDDYRPTAFSAPASGSA